MGKKKANKNFMSISKIDCLEVSMELRKNSNRMYTDACLLGDSKSYGTATSLLIHSMEEMMKSIILFMDGNGFEFRQKVKGIGNFFEHHKLRYAMAAILSIFHIFIEDMKGFMIKIKEDPNIILNMNKDKGEFERKMLKYFQKKIRVIMKEMLWFSKAEFLRQEGFYVDYADELKSPLAISEKQYQGVLERIDSLRIFSDEFFNSFNMDDENQKKEIRKLQKKMIKEDFYTKIGGLIPMFRDKESDPLGELSEGLEDFSDSINKFPEDGFDNIDKESK